MKRARWFILLAIILVVLHPLTTIADDDDPQALSRLQLLEILKTAPPAPNPPPVVTYPAEESVAADQRRTVGYDPITGKEKVWPGWDTSLAGDIPPDPPVTGKMPMFTPEGVEGMDADVILPITPTTPTEIYDTTSQPWNTIFKMLMRFNVGGSDYYYVCSAMAAGSFHVLTAGHCIYNWDPNDDGNTSDADWADEIWLWAAQTDQVDPEDDPDRLYGQAKMVYMRSYTGWTQNQNFDHDWGVVTLNRRDGDHTGWMGRETSTANSLNYSGYPTETPYVPAGNLVQYWGYDSGNVVGYSCCRIQLDAYIYGGHSGGPSWRYSDGSRWIQGIHSTSNRVGSAWDTYLTSGKRSDLNSYMSTDETARPPTARSDLIEYLFDENNRKDLLTNVVEQGGTIDVEYNAFNSGFANSSDFTVTFYLSTNATITTSDTPIGTRTHNLDAFEFTNPTATLSVPEDMAVNTYYVGWIMSGGVSEYTTDNNTVVISDETVSVTEPCPSEVALGDDTRSLSTLRRFRDRVLAGDATGRQLIAGYYTHAGEITRILLTHPRLMRQAAHLLYAFMPEMRRMAYGKTAPIEASELDEVTAFLHDLRGPASPGLQAFLDDVQAQLMDTAVRRTFGVK